MSNCPRCKKKMNFHHWSKSIGPKYRRITDGRGVFYCVFCGRVYLPHEGGIFNVTHLKPEQSILLSEAPKEFASSLYRAIILGLDIQRFQNLLNEQETDLIGTAEIIYKLIRQNNGPGISEDKLLQQVSKVRIPPITVERVVSKLKEQGLVFEPTPGVFKAV